MPSATRRPRVWNEADFQADLRAWRATSDPDAAERIGAQFLNLCDYIAGVRTRTRPNERDEVAAEGVLRCWRFLGTYNPQRTTGMNYFAQVATSRALNADDASRRRCRLLDKIAAKGWPMAVPPPQRDALDESRLQAALSRLSPTAAQVWRQTLESRGGVRRGHLVRRRLSAETFAAAQEELLAVLGPLVDEKLRPAGVDQAPTQEGKNP